MDKPLVSSRSSVLLPVWSALACQRFGRLGPVATCFELNLLYEVLPVFIFSAKTLLR
jgi:hypothetical protein